MGAALVVAVCGGGLVLDGVLSGSPSSTTFTVSNNTGSAVAGFTLYGPDGAYPFGGISPHSPGTTSVRLRTPYDVPFNYAFTMGGRTLAGTAAGWHDDDDRGRAQGCTLTVERRPDGSLFVFPDMR